MIELKINKEKKYIPTVRELTVKQYIAFMNSEKQDIINYLSVTLGVDYVAAWNLNINNYDVLFARIGEIKDYSKLKPRKFILDYEVEEISTIGQRFMIEEQSKAFENEELMCFILAVALIKTPDIGRIIELKNKLMDEPFMEILPTAFFLQKRFVNGKICANFNFKNLIRLMKILVLKNKRA